MSDQEEGRISAAEEGLWVKALDKAEAQIQAKAKADAKTKEEALLDIAADEPSWIKAFEKMKARYDAKEKEYAEKEVCTSLNRDGTKTEVCLGTLRRQWNIPTGVSMSFIENFLPGVARANAAVKAREAAKARFGIRTPPALVRYEQRMKEDETRRIQSKAVTMQEEIKDIHRMAADLKRDADLTGLVMKRLDYQIENEWADIRRNVAGIMKRVHIDGAVRPRKTAVSTVKIENNRDLRDAMGHRFGNEPSYEQELLPRNASARHVGPMPPRSRNASPWVATRRTKPATIRSRKSFTSAWEKAQHVKSLPARSVKAPEWEPARHVKPPPARSRLRKTITKRI